MSPSDAGRRTQLAQFLRNRRARLTPADVGLPPGVRRRTPGLRREEVAQLAGVGVTWYTWLEQGRPINVSTQILDAVARTLRLDRAEREHLYRLAGVPAVADPTTCEPLPPEIQLILDNLAPLPACVYNGRYDLLLWNRSYAAIFPGLVSAPPGERNGLWHMVVTPGCCTAVANRDAELPAMVATLRAAYGRHLAEPAWTRFVQRLYEVSPEFVRMWEEHDVAGPATRTKIIQNLDGATLPTLTTRLGVAGAPETHLIVYTPLDEDGYRLMEKFTMEPPRITGCPAHRATDGREGGNRGGVPDQLS